MIRTITGSFESARFEAELAPHRSIGKRGAVATIGGTGILLGLITGITTFMTDGKALPFVAPVAFAIQMGLTWAIVRNARDACERQTLTMDEQGLTLVHSRPDFEQDVVTRITPDLLPWTRIAETEVRGIKKLSLKLRTNEIPLGRFLPPTETEILHKDLRLALRRWDPVSRPT